MKFLIQLQTAGYHVRWHSTKSLRFTMAICSACTVVRQRRYKLTMLCNEYLQFPRAGFARFWRCLHIAMDKRNKLFLDKFLEYMGDSDTKLSAGSAARPKGTSLHLCSSNNTAREIADTRNVANCGSGGTSYTANCSSLQPCDASGNLGNTSRPTGGLGARGEPGPRRACETESAGNTSCMLAYTLAPTSSISKIQAENIGRGIVHELTDKTREGFKEVFENIRLGQQRDDGNHALSALQLLCNDVFIIVPGHKPARLQQKKLQS